eukprot:1160638-Pelagomonas_calceolata.AAC.1
MICSASSDSQRPQPLGWAGTWPVEIQAGSAAPASRNVEFLAVPMLKMTASMVSAWIQGCKATSTTLRSMHLMLWSFGPSGC